MGFPVVIKLKRSDMKSDLLSDHRGCDRSAAPMLSAFSQQIKFKLDCLSPISGTPSDLDGLKPHEGSVCSCLDGIGMACLRATGSYCSRPWRWHDTPVTQLLILQMESTRRLEVEAKGSVYPPN